MKKSLIFLVLSMLSGICHAQPGNKFFLNGALPDNNYDGKYVVLGSFDYSRIKRVEPDSVLIQNGKFEFTGNVPSPYLASFKINGTRVRGSLIIEPGHITVEYGADNSHKVSGTAANDEYSGIISLERRKRIIPDNMEDAMELLEELDEAKKTFIKNNISNPEIVMSQYLYYYLLYRSTEARNPQLALGKYDFERDIYNSLPAEYQQYLEKEFEEYNQKLLGNETR